MVTNNLVTLIISVTLLTVVYSQGNSSSATATTTTGGSSSSKSSTTAATKSSTKSTATTSVPPTLEPKQECPKHNTSCEDCVKAANYKCFFCKGVDHDRCLVYPVGSILPTKECSLTDARWGVCWVNFEALIITMSVIGGLIILTITCCCIRCCCCRGGDKKKYVKEEAKWERQKQERKQRGDERKADRKERMDEIRRKYGIGFKGLVKDDTPYQRFDA